jgi:nicrotizing toxin Mtb-like protein
MPRRTVLIAAIIGFVSMMGVTDASAAADISATGAQDTVKASIVDYSSPNGRFPAIRSAAFNGSTGFAAKKADGGGGDEKGVVCGAPFISGDPRLGPKRLPTTGVLGKIVYGYVPLGGLPPARFIYRYWQDNIPQPTWRFPDVFGFAHAGGWPNGRPLAGPKVLGTEVLVDRFGGPTGHFVSPYGSSYEGRAIPPDSINTFPSDPQHPCNYHVYKVIKPFTVDAGPSAPAFQQDGGDVQYHLARKYFSGDPFDTGEVSVQFLIDNKYLVPVN